MVILTLLTTAVLLANSSSEVIIENNINSSNVSISTSSQGNTSVKIENDKFEIEGTVSSVSENSFAVDGQSISKGALSINNLKQGTRVKVSGTITNSVLYADNITLQQKNHTEEKIEITPQAVEKVSPSAIPSSPPQASSSVEIKTGTEVSNSTIINIVIKVLSFLNNIF